MQVTVFGSGYVGLVAAACLAEVGNQVICVDVDQAKINALKEGQIPIYEPGLKEIVKQAIDKNNLSFTTQVQSSVRHGEVIFIAVGTPQDEDGSADLQYVLQVAKTIGQHLEDYTIIIDKSTVPVGTADKVRSIVQQELDKRQCSVPFDVVSNPEFLKEGAAIKDFKQPDRIILGINSPRSQDKLKTLYAPFVHEENQMMFMDTRSAELTKYAANAMLATKISFMNQMANIAEQAGADIEQVRLGIGADPRIGYHFINPGCGYGGSCFGKDVQALIKTAHDVHADSSILQAVESVNCQQKLKLFNTLEHHFQHNLTGKTIAVWGLSFKPGTDDMRDAPSRVLIENLWQHGAKVQAYDPQAMKEALRIYGKRDDFQLSTSPDEALEGADALVVLTEWPIFTNPNFDNIKQKLNKPVLLDGRNVYNPDTLKAMGFTYYGIGRGLSYED